MTATEVQSIHNPKEHPMAPSSNSVRIPYAILGTVVVVAIGVLGLYQRLTVVETKAEIQSQSIHEMRSELKAEIAELSDKIDRAMAPFQYGRNVAAGNTE